MNDGFVFKMVGVSRNGIEAIKEAKKRRKLKMRSGAKETQG